MNFNKGREYSGFTLEREENVNEINSIARVFIHKKSGARLLYLENDDTNKVFSIGFKTPPNDNTGIAHILEHSVLCGSRKFPTKEPFVELIKGSLNTFLNAMTFSESTIYPLASKNEKDFFNLMDVYLDAVFYPNIYSTKEILMQEGWHYEIEKPEDEITYKGVVYNEMKGAFSSPDGLLMRNIQKSLFPNNSYGYESGGDPDFIPDLKKEAFLGFHSKYYHPSNSYIFLYGDLNIEKALKFINEEYLINFDSKQINVSIPKENSFDQMRILEDHYSIAKEESEAEKTLMSLNFATGDSLDEELYLTLSTLEYLLLETQGAPLKQALLDANIGKDVYGIYDNSILQPVFSIVVKNSDKQRGEEFKKIVFNTLRALVEKGIDKKLIEACVNITEFKLREADFQGMPKGLFYYMTAMDSWLHGGDPLCHLKYEKSIEIMKKGLTSNYFEGLIEKYLLNNNHSSLVILSPKKGLADEKEKKLKEKLKTYKESLTEEELNNLVNDTKELIKRQTTPDTEEILRTIPVLSIEDIDSKVEALEVKLLNDTEIKILNHKAFTSKIAYLNFMFDSRGIKEEDIKYISLLTTLLGKINTKNYSYSELSNEVLINTGGIYFKSEVYGDSKEPTAYKPFIEGHCSVVVDKMKEGLDIVAEIIKNSIFDDKKRIRELTRVLISRIEMKLMDRGHQVVMMRLGSYFSPAYEYIERTSGYDFYKFLKNFDDNFDEKIDETIEKLKQIMLKVFKKNNVTIFITGEDKEVLELKKNLSIITEVLGNEGCEENKYNFNEVNKKEALITPSHVQYVAKGYNYKKLGYAYTGKLLVLKTILGMDYLWNKVRVQGGAYGAFATVNRSGNFIFTSYRDPNLMETLRAYDGAVEYLRGFSTTEREMLKYIIGTISELDMPLTPSMEGETALSYYMRSISLEDRQKERKEVLSATAEDIRVFASLVQDVMKQDFVTVLGNNNKINECSKVFNTLENVFN